MSSLMILLLLSCVLQVQCAKYVLVCKRNCDNSSLLDPTTDIEVYLDCLEKCNKDTNFKWTIKCFGCNQTIDHDYIIGNLTPSILIKRNTLSPHHKYNLSVYAGARRFGMELSMDKCSRKYPCHEQKFHFDIDYFGTKDIPPPVGLDTEAIKSNISDYKTYLFNMRNDTRAIRQKQLNTLNMIDLTIGVDDETSFSEVSRDIRRVCEIASFHPVVFKRAAEIGLKLIRFEMKKDPEKVEYDNICQFIDKFQYNNQKGFYITTFYKLRKHREYMPNYPVLNMNGEVAVNDYSEYDDFDVMFRSRKKITEEIRALTLEMFKIYAYCSISSKKNENLRSIDFNQNDNSIEKNILVTFTMFHKKLPKVTETKQYYDNFYFSEELKNELEKFINLSFVTIKLRNNYFWIKESELWCFSLVGVGNLKDEYSLRYLKNPIIIQSNSFWDQFNNSDAGKGYFKMPKNTSYKEISENHLGIHQLHSTRKILMLVITLHGINMTDKVKAVVSIDRRPMMSDFYGNDVINVTTKTKAGTDALMATKILNAAVHSNVYVAFLPSNKTLINNGVVKDDHKYYHYKVRFRNKQCYGYDEKLNKELDACTINEDDKVQWERMNCSCTRLGFIGIAFRVVDSIFLEHYFNYESPGFEFQTPYNYLVVIVVVVIGLLYCLFLCICCKRRNIIQQEIMYLMDNNVQHKNEYFIIVHTGKFNELAGTTANICFQLHGTEASSQRHLLRGQCEPVLQNCSEDWFYLLTEKDLGSLRTLDLWTDCYGFNSSWFCEKIEVVNTTTYKKWIFTVNSWFSASPSKVFQKFDINESKSIKRQSKCTYAFKNLSNHLWVKSFKRLHAPMFSSVERLTVIHLIVTMNLLMSMVFLGIPIFDLQACKFGYSEYNYGFPEILASCESACVTFLLTLMLIYIFSNSGTFTEDKYSIHNLKKFKFNYVCRAFAWIVMVLCFVGSIIIIALAGIHIGFTTSILWFHTSLVAVFLCIILEVFRVMIIAAVTSKLDSEQYTVDFTPIETCKEKLKYCYGIEGMRNFFNKFYFQIIDEAIQEKSVLEIERKRCRYKTTDFLIYVTYFILLFIIIMLNADSRSHFSYQNIEDVFVDDKHIHKIRLNEINSNKRFFRYMHKVFLPVIHRKDMCQYTSPRELGCQIDFNLKMFGIARIRQIRIQNNSCRVRRDMRKVVKDCHSEYSIFAQDKINYDPGWKPFDESSPKDIPHESWIHRSWLETKAMPYIGEFAIYPGGGYVIYFGRTFKNSFLILQYIANMNWIDERTRAVFLDVTFYNTNENIFHFLTIAIEHSATGAFVTSFQLHNIRFLCPEDATLITIEILTFLLVACTLLFARNKFLEYRELGSCCFWKESWNKIDVILIIIIMIYLLLSCLQQVVTEAMLNDMKKSIQKEYINFFRIVLYDQLLTIVTGILTFLSAIRLCRFLGAIRQYYLLELTLLFAAKYIIYIAIISGILIFLYGVFGFLLFGAYVKEFRNVWTSFITLLQIVFRLKFVNGLDSHQTMFNHMHYIYFFGYFALVFTLFRVFMTFILASYRNATLYVKKETLKTNYGILSYLKEYCAFKNSKSRGRLTNLMIKNAKNKSSKGKEDIGTYVDGGLRLRKNAIFNKVSVNSHSIINMHQIAENVINLIQDKIHLPPSEKREYALHVLSHFDSKFAKIRPDNDEHRDEYFEVEDGEDTIFCSTKRQQDIKLIVEHLVKLKQNKPKNSVEANRVQVQKQLEDLKKLGEAVDKLIASAQHLLSAEIAEKSTGVTFADLGLDDISVYSVDSEDIAGRKKTVYF